MSTRTITRKQKFVSGALVSTIALGAGVVGFASNAEAATYKCGDNIITHSDGSQDLLYRNCTNSTVRRQADVAYAADPGCKTIYGANTGVGDQIFLAKGVGPGALNQVYIRRSKTCS